MKTLTQNPADDSLDRALLTQSEMRKRWLYILPAVFITYSLAYLDRTNYGFGAAAGLAQTLNISSSRSALLGALFFLIGSRHLAVDQARAHRLSGWICREVF